MIVQIVLSMVLARLLIPETYGVVAILTVIVNFINLFADMGLGVSIIQHPEMEQEKQRELFSFSLMLGLILALVVCLLSAPVSIIYNNSDYYKYCPLVSIAVFFNALNIIPNSILIRDKRFDLIAIRSILSAIIPGIAAVFLAYAGAGPFSLIAQTIASSIFLFIWNYSKNPLLPKRFEIRNVVGLMGRYSLFQFLFSMLNYFTRNLDNLIIGAKLGDAELGYYNKAYTLNLYPNTIFTSVITGVLHPFIRDNKNDYQELAKKVLDILKLLSLFGVIIMMICYSCSSEIIHIMFGKNWDKAVPCFKMLSICIWAQMLSSVAGSVFLGVERTDQTFKCGVINLFLIVIAISIGVFYRSITVISLCVGITYNIIFFVTYYILINKTLHLSFRSFIKNLLSDYLFSMIFILCWSFLPLFPFGFWGNLFVKVLLCLCIYFGYLFFTRQIYRIKTIMKNFLNL